MGLTSFLARNLALKGRWLAGPGRYGRITDLSAANNTNRLIPVEHISLMQKMGGSMPVISDSLSQRLKLFGHITTGPEINTPNISTPIGLPEFTKDLFYRNPAETSRIITPSPSSDQAYVENTVPERHMFNRLRNDTKHRKRAFAKRGYFRRSRALARKVNRLSYAYALQGIDYEMIENLELGEIPDLKEFFKS